MKQLKKIISIVITAVMLCSVTFMPVSVTEAATIDTSMIPSEAVEFRGNYYLVVDAPNMMWKEAKAACEEMGGHLATVTTKAEQEFLAGYIGRHTGTYFLGGYKFTDTNWEWVTGEPWGYTNWRYDQPDDKGGSQSFLRLAYSSQYNWYYNWDDIQSFGDNGVPTHYICEWDTDTPVSIAEHNGHYYSVINLGLIWTDASDYCKRLGGHLATVTDSKEQEFVEKLATDRDRYWLGGTDVRINGQWNWVTGEAWSYTNWIEGHIDTSRSDYMFYSSEDKGWSAGSNYVLSYGSSSSYETIGFICEWDSAEQLANVNLRGDANGDGKISIKDATWIQQYQAGLRKLESKGLKAADADCDGVITVKDATKVQKYLAYIIFTF